jgi:cysteinyl-tRNA synthetase
MYHCGPTVYGIQHIGNLSMFVFTDVLRRTLEYNNFKVKQVINITDFGHLSGDNQGDADTGEDRMTKGLKREKMAVTMANMALLAERYAEIFIEDLQKLNIDTTTIEFPRASHYIPAQIAMITSLVEKSYAYPTPVGVYFDTSRLSDYGTLGGIDLKGQKEGARVEKNETKRNSHDFVLWKSDETMGWQSPWGMGFPGWHIECSAMIRSVLGEQIDIHTGGIEHIPIHHNNEIAQSESATGKKPFARFWMHRAHIQIEGNKIAKSDGNVVYLSDVTLQHFHPLALRYLFLGAQYRTSANFSWESLAASQTAWSKLVAFCIQHRTEHRGVVSREWKDKFVERINDDLDTPGCLAVVWEMLKDSDLSKADARATLIDFDRILGLGLDTPDTFGQTIARKELKEEIDITTLPEAIQLLITERESARTNKSWHRSDDLRKEIESKGYTLEDSKDAVRVFKR